MPIERQQSIEQTSPENFVHRVVPPHILAQQNEFPARIENRRRVQPASAGECFLRLPQRFRHAKKRFGLH